MEEKKIGVEEIKRRIKEIENTDIEEIYAEIDGTYSIMFANGYKNGKKTALKELLEES